MLCNREELRMVEASGAQKLRELSATQLTPQVARAQRLRDKCVVQSRAQRRNDHDGQNTQRHSEPSAHHHTSANWWASS